MLESVVLHKVDAEKGEGIELAKTHHVGGFPTFLLVNADLQPIDRWMGYTKPLLREMLDESMADLSTIDEKRAKLTKNPTAVGAARLGRYDSARGEYKAAVDLYRQAESLDPSTSRSVDIFDAMLSGLRSKAFTKDEVVKAADVAMEKGDAKGVLYVGSMMNYVSSQTNDKELMVRYVKAAVERTEGVTDPELVQERTAMLPAYALHVEKNAEKAVSLKRAGMPDGWMEDPDALNNYSWWAFENQVDLTEALKLARKGAELAPAGKSKAAVLDTAAEICNALDNCHEAVELTKLAIENDPENEFYKKQLERFQSILATKS